MHLTYLCSKHANWIWNHPEQAMHFLARDEFQGILLFEDNLFREAIPYLGCAYDITAILLEMEEGENPMVVKKLLSLSRLLELAYRHLALLEYQSAITLRTQSLLCMINETEAIAV